MEQSSITKIMKLNQDQDPSIFFHPTKRTYKYFTRHGILNNLGDLRKQTMRRNDTRLLKFEGNLDKSQNRDQRPTFRKLVNVIQSSKGVSELKLAIQLYDQTNSRGFLMLRRALKRHSSIQSFNFQLVPSQKNLNKDHLHQISRSLKAFSSLKKITLALVYMYHYNDPEVKNVLLSLIPGLKTQISLQSLHLMLQYPITITEKEIFKLCQAMHRLNSLNDINFMFR